MSVDSLTIDGLGEKIIIKRDHIYNLHDRQPKPRDDSRPEMCKNIRFSVNGFNLWGNMVQFDRPGECSPEKGMLSVVVTDVSTTWAEVIIRVKWMVIVSRMVLLTIHLTPMIHHYKRFALFTGFRGP